jgi:hypothetical protein
VEAVGLDSTPAASIRAIAVASTPEKGVDAGDERPELDRHGALAVDKRLLALDEDPLTVDEDPLALDEGVENLLHLEVLLTDAGVEPGETILLESVPLAEQANHLLARFTGRKVAESRDERGLEVREAGAHLGEAARQILVQRIECYARKLGISHRALRVIDAA